MSSCAVSIAFPADVVAALFAALDVAVAISRID